MTTTQAIDEMLAASMARIARAAEKQDLSTVEAFTKRAAELREMRTTVMDIEARLEALRKTDLTVADGGESGGSRSNTNGRRLAVEISQGMINQNLLTLTPHVKSHRIRPGCEMTIETAPNGDTFRTTLLRNGNKLRERGAIGRFYRDAHVREGDFVVLREVSPNQWKLSKASFAEADQLRREGRLYLA